MGILNRFKKDKKDTTLSSSKVDHQSSKKVSTPAGTSDKKTDTKKKSSVSLGIVGSEVIVKPLVTEKSATLSAVNQYVFIVKKEANRIQIRSAIKVMYGVTPTSVNIQNYSGKEVRFGRRRGKRKDWKKAIVTLPAGKTINVYEGV
jgi:large subunit ribosomal protein L23